MLDHAKVLLALNTIKDELFADASQEISIAREAFKRIAEDPSFQEKAAAISSPWVIPSWEGRIDRTFPVLPMHEPYQVISVDGSQVYPDRHQGTACYLINVGSIYIPYGVPGKSFMHVTQPYVYAGRKEDELEDNPMDLVNAKRQEFELQTGLELCSTLFAEDAAQGSIPQAFLFDGSLIFWHLASKSPQLKDAYMARYLGLMYQFYTKRILYGGYISLSKGKDLVNLVRIELCNFVVNNCVAHKVMDHIADNVIVGFFLQPFERTTVFKSNSPICAEYPDQLMPYFFYLHVGDEIARIEIPAWIANDEALTTTVARIMLDQARKGYGYPVAIAEAHEQAVVKGPDRDFFYLIINKLACDEKKRMALSLKSLKKRVNAI